MEAKCLLATYLDDPLVDFQALSPSSVDPVEAASVALLDDEAALLRFVPEEDMPLVGVEALVFDRPRVLKRILRHRVSLCSPRTWPHVLSLFSRVDMWGSVRPLLSAARHAEPYPPNALYSALSSAGLSDRSCALAIALVSLLLAEEDGKAAKLYRLFARAVDLELLRSLLAEALAAAPSLDFALALAPYFNDLSPLSERLESGGLYDEAVVLRSENPAKV